MLIMATFFESGVPKTGLSPTVDIYQISDNSLVVNGGAMSEIGAGGYKYDFATYDSDEEYYMIADSITLTASERYAVGEVANTQLVSDIWSAVVEGAYTYAQGFKLMLSALAGKLSGAGTGTIVIRDVNDTKDRITATTDDDGNRTVVTKDVS